MALAQCKKKEDKDCDRYFYGSDQYLVTYFRFLPGTSWNYINEISSDTNNIFVSAVNDHAMLKVDNHGGCEEPSYNYFDHIEISLSDGMKFQLIPDGINFSIPAPNGTAVYILNNNHISGTYIDTLYLTTGTYYGIWKYKGHNNNFQSGNYLDSSYFYWDEEFGLVRKEIYTGHGQTEIWNLSSATIVR